MICDNKQNVSDYYCYEITYQSLFHDDYQSDARTRADNSSVGGTRLDIG